LPSVSIAPLFETEPLYPAKFICNIMEKSNLLAFHSFNLFYIFFSTYRYLSKR
jgi:hypothetical protein